MGAYHDEVAFRRSVDNRRFTVRVQTAAGESLPLVWRSRAGGPGVGLPGDRPWPMRPGGLERALRAAYRALGEQVVGFVLTEVPLH